MSNLPAETVACKHCKGTGRIPVSKAHEFPVGATVHWKTTWWRYPKGANAVVTRHSRSGRKVRIRYETNDLRGVPDGQKLNTIVSPASLELR